MLTYRGRPLTARRVLGAVKRRWRMAFSRREPDHTAPGGASHPDAVRDALAGLERDLQELALVLRKLHAADAGKGGHPPR